MVGIRTARVSRPLRAGDVVQDEYGTALELVSPIGRGGQGEVWSIAGDRLAVKIIRGGRNNDRAMLRNRLAAVRRMDLSGIPVARPEAMLAGDHVGYAMELLADTTGIGGLAWVPRVDVEPVDDWHRRTGGLRRRLRLLALTAEALSRLHGRAIAYGDVSPANVLVSQGDREQVWLIDPDNLMVESSAADVLIGTPRYTAPELLQRRAGCSSLTDVFSFAVLAYQVLVLAHPFMGDEVYENPDLEEIAFTGELPWIDHSTDDKNRTKKALIREYVLTPGLRTLAKRTLEDGLHEPLNRPTMQEWADKLDQAALFTITCHQCRGTYFAFHSSCSWCGAGRLELVLCDLFGFVPPHPEVPELPGGETARLASVALTATGHVLVRARNALVCLDRGPGTLAAEPDDPVVSLRWGDSRVIVERCGRHEVWLDDPQGRRTEELRVGEPRPLPDTRWRVRFGGPREAHRLLRFRRQRGAVR